VCGLPCRHHDRWRLCLSNDSYAGAHERTVSCSEKRSTNLTLGIVYAMIILNPSHDSVRSIVTQYKEQQGAKKVTEIDYYVSEFDDVAFRIKTSWPTLTIYASMPGFAKYKSIGVDAHLQTVYGSGYRSGPVTVDVPGSPNFDFSVSFDVVAEELAAVLDKASNLKKNALAGAFRHVFGMALRKELTPKALVLPYRTDEDCYLKVNGDGVIVIFQLQFKEANDLIIADVFMKEFKEARRDQALGQAPSVSFQKVAPLELEGLQVKQGVNIGFVSFGKSSATLRSLVLSISHVYSAALFPMHYSAEKIERSVTALCTFRNYLTYHIKASKAYMHMRMRKRVETFLGILSKARPEAVGETQKKLASGKTFERKDR
jgi:actin related protein 2/3 complex subunit 2